MWGLLRLTPIILQVLLVHVLENTKMCEIAPRCIQHILTILYSYLMYMQYIKPQLLINWAVHGCSMRNSTYILTSTFPVVCKALFIH